MIGPYIGVQGVSTVTLSASGSAFVSPAKSNAPFKNLSFSIIPQESVVTYEVDVYHDGELVEDHTFSSAADRIVCHMSYPNKIFPANVGTNVIPRFFDPNREDPVGVSIRIKITNTTGSERVFLVYSTYEEYSAPRFVNLNCFVKVRS